jgi:hypothetical protein
LATGLENRVVASLRSGAARRAQAPAAQEISLS